MEEIKYNLIYFIKDTVIKLILDRTLDHRDEPIFDDKTKSLLYKKYTKYNSIDKAIETSIDNLIVNNTFKAYLKIFKIMENNDNLDVINIVEEFTNNFDDFELHNQFFNFIVEFLGLFEINRLHLNSYDILCNDLLKKLNIE